MTKISDRGHSYDCPVENNRVSSPAPRDGRQYTAAAAASCLAQGERYSANHGKVAIFPNKIVPDATGRISCRRVKPASNDTHVPLFASFGAVFPHRCDMRPVASGATKSSKTPENPWFAEYRSSWAKHAAAVAAVCRHPSRETGEATRLVFHTKSTIHLVPEHPTAPRRGSRENFR